MSDIDGNVRQKLRARDFPPSGRNFGQFDTEFAGFLPSGGARRAFNAEASGEVERSGSKDDVCVVVVSTCVTGFRVVVCVVLVASKVLTRVSPPPTKVRRVPKVKRYVTRKGYCVTLPSVMAVHFIDDAGYGVPDSAWK